MPFPSGFDHEAHARLARRIYADAPSGGVINRPAHFPGTPDEVAANRATHDFNDEGRCWECDCRAYGIASEWPCGAAVPRVDVRID